MNPLKDPLVQGKHEQGHSFSERPLFYIEDSDNNKSGEKNNEIRDRKKRETAYFNTRRYSKEESEHTIEEELKLQLDEKSARCSFEQNFFNPTTTGHKNSTFAATSSSVKIQSMMNTDLWALSYARSNQYQSSFYKMTIQSILAALFLLLEWLPFVVSLHYVGTSSNASVVGGYGMGIVWSNSFIEFIFGGFGLGVQILITQAHAEKKPKIALNLFKKGLAIVTVAMIPITLFMLLSGTVVSGISGKSQLGTYTYQYCTYGLPAFYLNGIYNILKGYFRARNETRIALISVSVCSFLSILWSYVFIMKVDNSNEVIGAALGRMMTEGVNVALLFMIMIYKFQKEDVFNLNFTKLALRGWTKLSKFCLPIGGLLLLEWIGYEIFTFQATGLSTNEFSAHIILNIFSTVYYQVSYGIAISITAYINQEMAQYDLVAALRQSKIGMLIILVFILITILPLSFLKVPFSKLFTNNAQIQSSIQSTYGLFVTTLAFDALLAAIVAISRGIGKQRAAVLVFTLSFYILGQLLASVFTYVLSGGIVGIWLAILSSVFVAGVSQLIWLGLTDWEHQVAVLHQKNIKEEDKRKKMIHYSFKNKYSKRTDEQEQKDQEEEEEEQQSENEYDPNQEEKEQENNNNNINNNLEEIKQEDEPMSELNEPDNKNGNSITGNVKENMQIEPNTEENKSNGRVFTAINKTLNESNCTLENSTSFPPLYSTAQKQNKNSLNSPQTISEMDESNSQESPSPQEKRMIKTLKYD